MKQNDCRKRCDREIEAVAERLFEDGAPVDLIIDRLLTYAAANIVGASGPRQAAAIFHQLAHNIEGGVFDHLAGRTRHTRQ